jgi:hypothetical protein
MNDDFVVVKDPEATLDYQWNWAPWLAKVRDTITASEFESPAGLSIMDSDHDDTSATAWIAGGVDGESYTVECKITTAGGRITRRKLPFIIKNQ